MSLILPKTCSMGSSKTGLVGTIGVTLLNPDGTIHTARTIADIYEIGGGCYGKNITFPDNWRGSLKWDTGGGSPVYATEDYIEGLIDEVEINVNDIKGTGFVKDIDSLVNIRPEVDKIQAIKTQVEHIFHIEGGKWKRVGTQMIFYKADNITEVCRFNLKKADGTPAGESDDPYEREKV